MNVTWKRILLHNKVKRDGYCLEANLVEMFAENGESEERLIMHLGRIEERFLNTKELGMRAFHRGVFWNVVHKKLDDLNLGEDLRKSIETALVTVVPRPADDWGLWAVTCVPKYEE